jgi:hypothetical protein
MKLPAGTILALAATVIATGSLAQDKDYAREVIGKLASPGMHGRGYVRGGDRKASVFIAREFRRSGLLSFGLSYFQPFTMPMNTFPGKIRVSVNGRKLKGGEDFTLAASSPGMKGRYSLRKIVPDSVARHDDSLFTPTEFVITPGDVKKLSGENPFGAAGIIIPVKEDENLWWHVSTGDTVSAHALLTVRNSLLEGPSSITIKAYNKFMPDHETRNVIGYIPGSAIPDSFILITAHYDHLGMMGSRVFFPGANDNASGTAMMMDLARWFSSQGRTNRYSLVFVAFAAEEAGLLGSRYLVQNPPFSLGRIKWLLNLDMVGTGSEGITVVNGSVFPDPFDRLKAINDENQYVAEVKARGESCNSDHCPFYQEGVTSFFIYTRGPEFNEYHNLKDRPENLPLTAYDGLFRLVRDFILAYP